VKRLVLLWAWISFVVLLACSGVVLAQEHTTSPASEQTIAPEQTPPAGSVIAGQYIVVLKEEVRDPTAVAQEQARDSGAEIIQTYQHSIRGYVARMSRSELHRVRADEQVDYVEPDQVVKIVDQTLPWGVDKIDAEESSTVADNGSGAVSGVSAYIIDTGIYKKHRDLNVVDHVNFHGGKNTDCNGHGTHVAGTLAAKDNGIDVVGAAPGAPLTGVKVIGCKGWGLLSNVIKGVEWVTAKADKPAIANMSLVGGASRALDTAVRRSAKSGVFYSVAAGNSGKRACKYSPARAGAGTDNGIATVAATNQDDKETRFSNYGSCVDIWAPGARILSTKLGGGTATMSGTSMAAPHVGGGAALYLSFSSHVSASSSKVEGALTGAAAKPGTKSKDGRTILLENVNAF
jgi:subtilisin family serine protease